MTSPLISASKPPDQIKVILERNEKKEVIKDCPLKYEDDDPRT